MRVFYNDDFILNVERLNPEQTRKLYAYLNARGIDVGFMAGTYPLESIFFFNPELKGCRVYDSVDEFLKEHDPYYGWNPL